MTRLYYLPGGAPAILPFSAQTPDGQWRTDLANHPESVAECGFVLAPPRPADTDAQTAEWDASAEAWVMVDRPPPPPVPVPQPAKLGRLGFVRHVQKEGGMTDAMLVEARNDPLFAALWIKLDLSEEVERDDPLTTEALGALAQAGYMPAGAEAVVSEWPPA